SIGDVAGVSEIVPAFEYGLNTNLIHNPFVVSWKPDAMGVTSDVYLFPGDASRQLNAPYFLLPPNGYDEPRRAAIGSFTQRKADGADIAVFAACNGQEMMSCGADLWLLPTMGGANIEPFNPKMGDSNAPTMASLTDMTVMDM